MQNEFGKLLRAERKQEGHPLRVIAAHLGVSVSYLSDVERGRRDPLTLERIYKVAEFLNQDPFSLIEAALRSKPSFELSTNISKAALETAVILIKRWEIITDAQHKQIQRIFAGVSLSNYSDQYKFKGEDGNVFYVRMMEPMRTYDLLPDLKLSSIGQLEATTPIRRFIRLEFSEGSRQWFEYHESPPCTGSTGLEPCCKNSPLYRKD
jgi:transcriptional regulator with XRE-family HTH domain